MAIPSAQLETWSHQGGTGISTDAYARIQLALTKDSSPLNARGVRIFLQGSYANDTNIHAESDIDIVVLYEKVFYEDTAALTPMERQIHATHFSSSAYRWHDLRAEVLTALNGHFGVGKVDASSGKAIKVQTGSGRMTADVLPAIKFRRYATYPSPTTFTAHLGLQFFDSAGNIIRNYPDYHIERGQNKNQTARTGGRYKPTIRVFKNLRSYLVDNGKIGKSVASSYLVECALYNVPDNLFIGNFSDTVPAILRYLLHTPYATFLCQNGVTPLIGNEKTQWSAANFSTFVVQAANAWDTW